MTQTLRLYIDARWPTPAKTAWVLLAPTGAVLREGTSDPTHWPAADVVEAVLGATEAVWHKVKVPGKAPRGEYARLLAYALEDRLLRDPDSQHFTVTRRDGDEAGVLVVARDRLRQIVSALSTLGRAPTRIVSELQCAPIGGNAWHLTLNSDNAVLRGGEHDGVALDNGADGAPPPLLGALLAADSGEKKTLVVHLVDGQAATDLTDWAKTLGIDVRRGEAYHWHASSNAANLLHDEFAPRHLRQAWLARLRPALWLAAGALTAHLLLGLGQLLWLHHRLSDMELRTTQLFQQAFPKAPVVDVAAQMTRQLDELRTPHGLLRSDDALALAAALADALGADGGNAVQSLRYEDGVLEVVLAPSATARAASLSSQLTARGWLAGVKAEGKDGTKLLLRRGRSA